MALQLIDLTKSYPLPQGNLEVLQGLNLELERGETIAILGPSGAGKSTLLSLVAGLDNPTSGQVLLNHQDLAQMKEGALTRYRAQNLGIVFQQFHLMEHLTAIENVTLPLELAKDANALEKGKAILEKVGLAERMDHFPKELSGGECQRVAIARALVIQPTLMLADEPTGNLDEHTGKKVADLFFDLVEKENTALLMVTHNKQLAARCQKQYVLKEGGLHALS